MYVDKWNFAANNFLHTAATNGKKNQALLPTFAVCYAPFFMHRRHKMPPLNNNVCRFFCRQKSIGNGKKRQQINLKIYAQTVGKTSMSSENENILLNN